VGRTFLSNLSFVHHLKKQAPSAHVSRFGLCTNGVQYGVEQAGTITAGGQAVGDPLSAKSQRRLLRNVDLFFFVDVAQKVYQTTDKRDCCQAECDPSRGVTSGGVRISHKLVKIKDRPDGRRDAYQYRENIFKAFHFDLRPLII
jgi:hypothetical protein